MGPHFPGSMGTRDPYISGKMGTPLEKWGLPVWQTIFWEFYHCEAHSQFTLAKAVRLTHVCIMSVRLTHIEVITVRLTHWQLARLIEDLYILYFILC